jgi:hypothetical protein
MLRRLHLLALVALPMTMASTASAGPIDPNKTIDLPPPPDKPQPPAPPQYRPPPSDGFYWMAEPRAHKWAAAWRPIKWPEVGKVTCRDEDGKRICIDSEQTYDPDYVHPKSFNIIVSGCVDKADWDLNMANKPSKRTYTWTSSTGQTITGASCANRTLTFPAQGTYPVSMTVDGKTFKQVIRVRDLLIVAMGDSMSSGEGAPDSWKIHSVPGAPAGWVDRQCHRSKNSPGAQAAMAIESMDPRTSVTFLSFACSGATLDTDTTLSPSMWNGYTTGAGTNKMSGTGILGPYIGIESPLGDDKMGIVEYAEKGGFGIRRSQVEQVKVALGGKRRADAVVMSAGVNDARFAAMMHTCALYTDCWDEGIGSAASKMPLEKRFTRDAGRVTDMYTRLGKELNPLANRVLVFEYPSLFTDDNKKLCPVALDDIALTFLPSALRLGIDAKEANWIHTYAGPTLHNFIKAGTTAAGFEFVPGAWEAFKGHGYCASQQQRWFTTAGESNMRQGPSVGDTKGTIHPNPTGYRELATIIVKDLTGAGNNTRPRPLSDSYTATAGTILKVDVVQGVLANDSDTDLIADLRVKTFTQPSSKVAKVQVEPDGSFSYNPAGFVGSDTFFYTLTDGVGDAFGRVVVTVQPGAPATPGAPKVIMTPLPVKP